MRKSVLLLFLLLSVTVYAIPRESFTENINSNKLTIENIQSYMDEIGIIHSEIVIKQVILETGWLKSKLCAEHNNLFGMHFATKRPNKILGYVIADNGAKCATFDSWKDSVYDYYLYQQYWIEKGKDVSNYYKFLSSIGYSETSNYVKVLKQIKV